MQPSTLRALESLSGESPASRIFATHERQVVLFLHEIALLT